MQSVRFAVSVRLADPWVTVDAETKVSLSLSLSFVVVVENPEPTNVLLLKPGVDKNIATHASPTDRNIFFVQN